MSLTSVLLAFAPALAAKLRPEKSAREKVLEHDVAVLENRLDGALARCEELERRMTGGLLERYAQQALTQQALTQLQLRQQNAQNALLYGNSLLGAQNFDPHHMHCNCIPDRASFLLNQAAWEGEQ
jgi:hypothetical protein